MEERGLQPKKKRICGFIISDGEDDNRTRRRKKCTSAVSVSVRCMIAC